MTDVKLTPAQRTKAVDAVEVLLRRHIPQYTYSRTRNGQTRTDAVILTEAVISAVTSVGREVIANG